MRKFLAALIVVGVVAAGGAIYAANRDSSDTDTPVATDSGDSDVGNSDQQAADGSARGSDQSRGGSSLVTEVLDGLVADDTITEAQAVAIEAALEAKRQEVRDRVEAGREGQGGDRHGGGAGHGEDDGSTSDTDPPS